MSIDPTAPTVNIDSFEFADSMLRLWLAADERRDRQGRRTSGLGITIGIPRRSY
jgi:hypothetical protein